MLNIRVWNLESDREVEAVRFLENTFLRFRQLEYLAIWTAGRSALRKCHRKGVPVSSDLRKTLQHYLAQDDYIIFILDSDQQRQQKSSPLVNEIKQIVKDSDFADKVFFYPTFRNGVHLYQPSGSGSFHVSVPKLKVSANGFGKNGIGR